MFVNHSNVAKKLPKDVDTAGCAQAYLLILAPLELCKLLQLSPYYYFKLADPGNPTDEELDRGQLTTLKTFLTHNVSADIWVQRRPRSARSETTWRHGADTGKRDICCCTRCHKLASAHCRLEGPSSGIHGPSEQEEAH